MHYSRFLLSARTTALTNIEGEAELDGGQTQVLGVTARDLAPDLTWKKSEIL